MLELKDISFKKDILKDVSLKVKPGELIVITGPNGSGKSTLTEIVAGIKTPNKGQILFAGKNGKKTDITDLAITDRAKLGIAYSFQQPVHFKGVKVRDLLQIALTGEETLVQSNDKKINQLLESVGLEPSEYLDREINSSLSGGELKRIEIASVLARGAKLTIFDEPEAGIDIWSFDNLIKVFKKSRKEIKNSSIIIISHQKKIMEIADRIILINKGKIEKSGDAKTMLEYIEKSNRTASKKGARK